MIARAAVLVDANVIIDVLSENPRWQAWSEQALAEAADRADLVINPIIYAELAGSFSTAEALDAYVSNAGYAREDLPWDAAYEAGRAYVRYRRGGGGRRSPIADFYIGAHAATRGYTLLTRDAARYSAVQHLFPHSAPDHAVTPARGAGPRVLVSRTDRIGDVALTLPLCGLLKARLGATVLFLGRGYTRPVLEACAAVDEILEWEGGSARDAAALVRGARADVVLHVFPRPALAWGALLARVPVRVGTARRWYHWPTCTVREPVARRGSDLHEAQLDVRLARALLPAADLALGPAELAPFGALAPRVPVPPDVAPLLAPGRFTLVAHPRSLGSAAEWPLGHWAALVAALPAERFRVLVTGSAAEGASMRDWLRALPAHAHDLTGRLALAELIAVLAAAGGVVAASTGPLHLAALLGTPTLGLFSPVRPRHPGRWGPVGPRAEALAAGAPCPACAEAGRPAPAGCTCLGAVAPAAVRARVEAWARAGAGAPAPA